MIDMRFIVKNTCLHGLCIMRLVSLLLLTITFALVASCGSDSDSSDGDIDNVTKELMAKKWTLRDVSFDEGNDDHVWVDDDSETLYFLTESTGIIYIIQKDYDSDLGNDIDFDYETFTYTVVNNYINIYTDKSSFSLNYNKDYLSDNSGLFYEASPMNSSDYSLIKSLASVTGKCGDNLTYIYNKKKSTIQINGSGDMYDYTTTNQPWHDLYITEVVIDEDVTSIGNNAFNGLNVTDVDWTGSTKVERIGKGAFRGCMMTDIEIPNTVKEIDDEAFANCKYLKNVSFINGSRLERVGSYIFDNCNKSIKLNSIQFGKTMREIASNAFVSNSMGTIEFSEGIQTIGARAFFGGITNTGLILPNSLETIGETTFSGKFSEIVIGTGLKEIGKCAFISSASSGKMYINQKVPPTAHDCVIADATEWNNKEGSWTLYVPKGCKSAYSTRSPWNKFKAIYEDASLDGESSGDDGNGSSTGTIKVVTQSSVTARAFSAILYGEVQGINGGVNVGFLYGETADLKTSGSKVKTISEGTFNLEIEKLQENTKYYYCAYACVNDQYYYGEVCSFTTKHADSPNNLTYIIDGKEYKMILVEGAPDGDFYMMQTELPPSSSIRIGNEVIDKPDRNFDGAIIKSEMRNFLDDIRTQTGIAFRLPTKKEWQYAASGGKKSLYYKYSGSNNIEEVAWYSDNSQKKPHEIAQKSANELGLYDMSGNYSEVTNDTDDIYYVDGYICGGSWKDNAANCTVSSSKVGPQSGNVSGLHIKEKNAFDARTSTIRLVYSK